MLTLYFAPGSSSFAVHIALHEIGVPFEGKPMSFNNDDMRSPDYLKLNPEGKVPTLVIDGHPLTEVAAILYYLAKRFPDAELLPRDDIEADAQALSWMSFAASTLHPARRHGLDHARDVWGIADRRLGSGWALESYSIADIHLFRLYWRFANSLKPAPDEFPNLTAHYARVMARPAVQRTIEIESAVGYGTAGVMNLVIARSEATKQSSFRRAPCGLLRGACHRARIRATRWLAMTAGDHRHKA